MKKDFHFDLEWYMNGKIFLMSYAYNLSKYGQLYGKALNRENIKKILKGVENIYVYGPDISRLEKAYDLNLKQNYNCYNLLGIARHYLTYTASYKLSELEKLYSIPRTANYKSNIFQLYSDFNNPKKRAEALMYNMEDTLNMLKVKRAMFKEFKIKLKDLDSFIMK